MGIVRKGILKGVTGRVGQVTLYNKGSQTMISESTRTGTDASTPAQINRRVLMANVVSQYRANRNWILKGFQHKPLRQSDYNAFCAANLPNALVALTKQQAAAGACVLTNDYVTLGNLPPILYKASNISGVTGYITNIRTGGQRFSTGDTIGVFSSWLLDANSFLREGDQLSFVGYRQIISPFDSFPYVECSAFSIVLSRTDTNTIGYIMTPFDWSFANIDNYEYLTVDPAENFDAFAIVLSRRVRGQLAVSTARCFLIHDDVFRQFVTEDQISLACASYGVKDPVFLDTLPDITEEPGTTDPMYYAASRGVSTAAAAATADIVPFSSISGLYLSALLANGMYVRFVSTQALPITNVQLLSGGNVISASISCTKVTGSDRDYVVQFGSTLPIPSMLITGIKLYNGNNVVQEVVLPAGGTNLE